MEERLAWKMRSFVAASVVFLLSHVSECSATPQEVAPILSPDGRFTVAIHLEPEKPELAMVDGQMTATLILRKANSGKILQRLSDLSDTSDYRNGISLKWSPTGEFLVVQSTSGQITNFSIYRLSSRHLAALKELPVPKKLAITPEHQKSRGYREVQNWLGKRTFIVENSFDNAFYTYRVIKQNKFVAVHSRERTESEVPDP